MPRKQKWNFDLDEIQSDDLDRIDTKIEDLCTKKKERTNIRFFNGLMFHILAVLNAVEIDAKTRYPNDEFVGLNAIEIEKIFANYNIEKDTLFEHLYKLTRVAFIIRRELAKNDVYYKLNTEDFLCYDGIYMFHYPNTESHYNLFLGHCDISHFCHQSCLLSRIFAEKSKIIGNGISDINEKIDKSKFFEYMNDIIEKSHVNNQNLLNAEIMFKNVAKIIKNEINIENLNSQELVYYANRFGKCEDHSPKIMEKNFNVEFENMMRNIDKSNYIQNFVELNTSQRHYTASYHSMSKRYDPVDPSEIEIMEDPTWINPIMISLMNFIVDGIRYTERKYEDKIFPGFSLYNIEKLTRQVWVSNETIYENIYKLTRLRYIKQFRYTKDKKPTNARNKYYFDLNNDRFPCYGGYYVKYWHHPDVRWRLISGFCERMPFCTKSPKDCKLNEVLNEKLYFMLSMSKSKKVSLHFFDDLESLMRMWNYEQENETKYSDLVASFVKMMWKKVPIPFEEISPKNGEKTYSYEEIAENLDDFGEIIEDLFPVECIYYGKLIENAKNDDDRFLIWDSIINTVHMKRYRKKKRMRKKNKTDKKLRDQTKKEILLKILQEPPMVRR